ncbi:hypothetical protein I7I51_07743 [Histoplasma capsulatum]|uniref:Uncharacterized protein n=1 Tax=Ajellomyces capsulatus TaxID=5037 RepID=A0A8A1LYN5_AJECA|nr:hypothetical protein I7I51_07743 [Histoplasma capsulatum]
MHRTFFPSHKSGSQKSLLLFLIEFNNTNQKPTCLSTQKMKSPFSQVLSLAALALTWSPTQAAQLATRDITMFEERFLNSLEYQLPNNTIKLIGFKKVKVPEHELGDLNQHYMSNPKEWGKLNNYFYDPPSGTFRIYFPVEGALVSHDGEQHEANHLGELSLQKIHGDCSVLGRKQTSHVTGVEGNIIKDGIIYLENPPRPHAQYGNAYVYDFGVKVVLDHDHSGRLQKRSGKKSCMNNHGGPNCSNKYNIHGKCKRRSDVCMDYNGWFTNCKKNGPTWRNFPGSDCDKALGRGHCWNEVM